jgi:hypothetical protein
MSNISGKSDLQTCKALGWSRRFLKQEDENRLSLQCYDQLHSVPKTDWESLLNTEDLTLSYDYLRDLTTKETAQKSFYVLFTQAQTTIGVAYFTIASFSGPRVIDLIESSSPSGSKLLKWARVGTKPIHANILCCGGSSTAEHYGFRFHESVTYQEGALALEMAAEQILKTLYASNDSIGAVFFHGSPYAEYLGKRSYTCFEAEPNLKLSLDESWQHFEDYLSALSSKYRVKAKRADRKSEDLVITPLNYQQFQANKHDLNELYKQVVDRAEFALTDTGFDSISSLMNIYETQVKLYRYQLNGQTVGFRVSVFSARTLYAYLVGFDYRFNRTYSIYPRMLNDYLREGISAGMSVVHFGRTAAEIKSTLGATPTATQVYLKHTQNIINCALPWVSARSSTTPRKIHQPFKVHKTLVHSG